MLYQRHFGKGTIVSMAAFLGTKGHKTSYFIGRTKKRELPFI